MSFLLGLFFIFSFPLHSQPIIHTAGDGWQLKIDSALSVIKEHDPEKYALLDLVCDEVDFWIGDFSSSEVNKEGKAIIYIAVKDVKLNSINNLACVLVHESLHLYFRKSHFRLSKEDEEKACYRYELDFLQKVPKAESWLLNHAKNQS
jgi:hypothetical protein